MSTSSRKQIISLLENASAIVENGFLPQECRFNEMYHGDEHDCRLCELGPDCNWLTDVREQAALASKSDGELRELLEFAVEYCASLAVYLEHEPGQCACPMCTVASQGQAIL